MEQTPNKSQHTKSILEKDILPPLLLGFELATFHEPGALTNKLSRLYRQAIPALPTSYPGSTDKLSRFYRQAIPALPTNYPGTLCLFYPCDF